MMDKVLSYRRFLEDESFSTSTHGGDDDNYHALYHSCTQDIHDELINFIYIAGSILWYVLLVGIIHKCCLKVQLDGAPIYDFQYWFCTATIQFILIIISILLFFPYPCSIEISKHKLINSACLQHCQQDRYICIIISGIESTIGIYWYYLAYGRYQMAQRLRRTTTNMDDSRTVFQQSTTMDNGIFSKLPNIDEDIENEDGLEMTENSDDSEE